MATMLLRQVYTLTIKNLRLAVLRHAFSTMIRALLLPVLIAVFLCLIQNLFTNPSTYGIGPPTPVLSLLNAMNSPDVPSKLVMVNNHLVGGDIDHVIHAVTAPLVAAGKTVQVVPEESQLLDLCRQTPPHGSDCYAAAVFHSSPTEGSGAIWNYTIRVDAGRGLRIYVQSTQNDVQVYPIPLQHAIDWAIASQNSSVDQALLPQTVLQYPYTSETESQRSDGIRMRYQGSIRNALAAAFFLVQIGVMYHLVGFMSSEREGGISQLMEVMMPYRKRWHPRCARLFSYHLAFTLIYLPGWILAAIIFKQLAFVNTKFSVLAGFLILAGLSFVSSAIFGAAFFRRSQLSAITVTAVAIILAILGMVFARKGNWVVGLLSLFFPPINFVNFLDELTYFEEEGLPMNIYSGAPGRNSRLSGLLFWWCFVLQILIYPLFAGLVEKCFHATRSKHRRLQKTGKTDSHPIQLINLSKVYPLPWYLRWMPSRFRAQRTTVIAVESLSASIAQGQIYMLLGPNGSGKTTTLRCIAGIEEPTDGFIDLDGTGGLGFCPQENVFWELLTVEEHVRFMTGLKKMGGQKLSQSDSDLIKACDLEGKAHALAKTLSGGQKRKLQLAMMFSAGSQVCCVDEVSSGLDPQSRRKIWEILLAKRGEHTIILTTHFLDEADQLADHVLVMSNGKIQAEGSAVDLKHRWGGGYNVEVDDSRVSHEHSQAASNDAPPSQPRSKIFPVDRPSDVTRIVEDLERKGVTDYRITGPTMEKVFFNILGQPFYSSTNAEQPEASQTSSQSIGIFRSVQVMLMKRLIILRRNFVPHLLALLLGPFVAGIAAGAFLNNYNALLCGSQLPLTNPNTYTPSSLADLNFVIGPSNQVPQSTLQRLQGLIRGQTTLDSTTVLKSFHVVDTLEDFNSFIGNQSSTVTPGGIFLGSHGSSPTFAYQANGPLYNAIFTQNVVNTLMTNISINTGFAEFVTYLQPDLGDSIQYILYFGLAMTTYTAFFALYPTRERQQNVRALHYSNGLRPLSLWIAYTTFDFCFVVAASVLVTVILYVILQSWFALGYFFIVLILFGLTSLLAAFTVSLFVRSQLAAFAICAGGQAVTIVVYFIAYFAIVTGSSSASTGREVYLLHYLLSLIVPSGSLARAILLSLNTLSIGCSGSSLVSYPGDINAYGGPILYLLCQSALLFTLLVYWESGAKINPRARRAEWQHLGEVELGDADILAEAHRVGSSEDRLQVLHVSKTYAQKRVVDDVTFGVGQDEIFTLLGPNGAGKTTLMGVIRGEGSGLDRYGDVVVAGISLSNAPTSLRAQLGYCPQFDAIDQMTVKEHLKLYAMIKGIRDNTANVTHVLNLMGLVPFANRMSRHLSGGYKRRLSLGIALIGNPKVLLLDEPSSGLDVVAKRIVWHALRSASRGKSTLLTTHSMEEAEALADRVGIMDRRMLAVGSIPHLRQRYGNTYTVHLISRSAPHTTTEEIDRLRDWALENFDNVRLEGKSLHGQVKFNVSVKQQTKPLRNTSETEANNVSTNTLTRSNRPNSSVKMIFATLESHREALGLEYYSVTPGAMEDVFFKVIGQLDDQDREEKGNHYWSWRRVFS